MQERHFSEDRPGDSGGVCMETCQLPTTLPNSNVNGRGKCLVGMSSFPVKLIDLQRLVRVKRQINRQREPLLTFIYSRRQYISILSTNVRQCKHLVQLVLELISRPREKHPLCEPRTPRVPPNWRRPRWGLGSRELTFVVAALLRLRHAGLYQSHARKTPLSSDRTRALRVVPD